MCFLIHIANWKIKPYLRSLMIISSHSLNCASNIMKASYALVVGLHAMACAWHMIGDMLDQGWVKNSNLEDAVTMDPNLKLL